MKKLVKGTLASTCEIAAKVNEIIDWIIKQETSNNDE